MIRASASEIFLPTPKYSISKLTAFLLSVAFVLAGGVWACKERTPLLNEVVDTVPEPDDLHVAYIRVEPEDPRHADMEKCFDYEPGIHFYDTTETFRLMSDRGINADGLADKRDLGTFRKLNDFAALIISIPRGDGVLLRSFRFGQQRVVEGFMPTNSLNCKALFNWLNFLLVVSFPDNGYIFVDGAYMGRTPRWVAMLRGTHTVRAETLERLIAEQKVTIPGKIQVTLSRK